MSASNVDRIESAANITMTVSKGGNSATDDASILKVPVSRLDTTKDVEISEIREGSLKASGYSVTMISFSGSIMFKGERVHGPENEAVALDELLFDDDGVPNPVSVSITHELSGKVETYEDVMVTSDSYEVQSESETETAYDWIAMDRDTEDPSTDN
jgi:hypothetical protein